MQRDVRAVASILEVACRATGARLALIASASSGTRFTFVLHKTIKTTALFARTTILPRGLGPPTACFLHRNSNQARTVRAARCMEKMR